MSNMFYSYNKIDFLPPKQNHVYLLTIFYRKFPRIIFKQKLTLLLKYLYNELAQMLNFSYSCFLDSHFA